MLVLTRRANERIFVDGGRIVVTVVEVDRRGIARIGIDAPPGVVIDREEIHNRKLGEGADRPPPEPGD